MDPESTRRSFLLCSLGLIAAGCAGNQTVTSLPDVPWKPRLRPTTDPSTGDDSWVSHANDLPAPGRPRPTPSTTSSVMNGVIPRSQWSTGDPIPARMDRLTGVSRITIHHDGMTPFYSSSANDAAARLDLIRRAHLGRGWGDIGYHYVIDPAGRVWEARPIYYQGAHVKNENEGNIGVMCLGNFEAQSPSAAQVQAMVAHVCRLQLQYRIPADRVYTHRELGPTACPGRNMQAQVMGVRHGGNFG